jgi:hypothetical protein
VNGFGPWDLGFADGGFTCNVKNVDLPNFTSGGNLQLGVRITPVLTVKKVVSGDDPGIAFPIAVSCTADGTIPAEVSATAGPEIVLDDIGDTDATTVGLKNGESANIPIVIGDAYIDSVTCTVSESLTGVTLPEGYTCSAPVIDHPQVIWEEGEWSASPVVLTNSCTKVVALQPNFPG